MTLKEYITKYKPKTIQLIHKKHLVSIDKKLQGSTELIEIFSNITYDFMTYSPDTKHLILYR